MEPKLISVKNMNQMRDFNNNGGSSQEENTPRGSSLGMSDKQKTIFSSSASKVGAFKQRKAPGKSKFALGI